MVDGVTQGNDWHRFCTEDVKHLFLREIEKIPSDELSPSSEYTNEDLTRDPKAAKVMESVLSKLKPKKTLNGTLKRTIKSCFYAEYGKDNPLDRNFFRGLTLKKNVGGDTIVTIRAWGDLVTAWWWWFASHEEKTGGVFNPQYLFMNSLLFDLRTTLKSLTKDRA